MNNEHFSEISVNNLNISNGRVGLFSGQRLLFVLVFYDANSASTLLNYAMNNYTRHLLGITLCTQTSPSKTPVSIQSNC